MSVDDLPALNATLNGISSAFLLAGFLLIKKGRKIAHRNAMIGALISSTVFLASYLVYHYYAGSTRFVEPAWFRPFYLFVLLTHIVLAMAIVPLVLRTVWLAARGRFDKHRAIARWTWPIWMYVSVTGVLIYLFLYQIFPQPRG